MDKADYQDFLTKIRGKSSRETARWATITEAKVLLEIAEESEASIIFESGTANGFSSCWMALAKQKPAIYTFDPVNREKIWDRHEELKPLQSKIFFGQMKFEDGIKSHLPFFTEHKLMFFIDGNHSKSGVARDFDSVSESLKKGDEVVFHDSHTEGGVVSYIVKLRKRFPTGKFVDYRTERGITKFTYGY